MLAALLLAFTSCGGGFGGGSPDEGPSPWTTGELACYSADGCPSVRCGCLDGSVTEVRGCIDGLCLDDHHAFCTDRCESRGGRDTATVVYLYACLAADDRDACLACRDAAARECNAKLCSDELDTMLACLAERAPADLPEGAETFGWDDPGAGPCYPERIAHRNCLLDDCASFDGCEEYRDYHPPLAR